MSEKHDDVASSKVSLHPKENEFEELCSVDTVLSRLRLNSPTSMILLFDHMTENTLFYIMYRFLYIFVISDQFSL
jgi:hypothetical protein